MSNILKAARCAHDAGWGVHWLKPKSKAPIGLGWTKGERATWAELEKKYRKGFNLGVRLGFASQVGEGYLAVIDCDVKSGAPHHLSEMERALALLGLPLKAPQVISGRGGGSRHIYILTKRPEKPRRLKRSEESVKVKMPSVSPSKRDKTGLSEEEIEEGYRMRPAWEISLMGEGQQVVMPPSIHPDTGAPYKWAVEGFKPDLWEAPPGGVEVRGPKLSHVEEPIRFEEVELDFSGLDAATISMIVEGEGVEDRSAALFTVAMRMKRAGLTENQIISVLTDKRYYLGLTAYEHTQSESRVRAAKWVARFTVNKAVKSVDVRNDFPDEVAPNGEVALEENEDLLNKDWRHKLERYRHGEHAGKPKPTLKNTMLILKNIEGPKPFIEHDTFANRIYFKHQAPWGTPRGEGLSDKDLALARLWFAEHYKIEPVDNVLHSAFTALAFENQVHPVRDWLDSLEPWDGEERLNTWLMFNFEAEGEPDYLAQVFRKWMVALVKRVYEPGAKFDWMPIFEGMQGVGKSSFGRLLVGDKWFVDWLPDVKDKDAGLGLQGVWMVELGEITHLRREIEPLKAFLTRTTDKARPAFGRYWVENRRQCVFFGTTNQEKYFIDETGNRRFKPVKVGQLDFDALRGERHQLFAEALYLYRHEKENEISLNTIEGEEAKEYEKITTNERVLEDDSVVMMEQILGIFKAQFLARKRAEKVVKSKGKKLMEIQGHLNPKRFRILELWDVGSIDWNWPKNHRFVMLAAKAVRKLGGKKVRYRGKEFWRLNKWEALF